jgi:dsRNA-specific ribonuclease
MRALMLGAVAATLLVSVYAEASHGPVTIRATCRFQAGLPMTTNQGYDQSKVTAQQRAAMQACKRRIIASQR